jgi:hypothetical protein
MDQTIIFPYGPKIKARGRGLQLARESEQRGYTERIEHEIIKTNTGDFLVIHINNSSREYSPYELVERTSDLKENCDRFWHRALTEVLPALANSL